MSVLSFVDRVGANPDRNNLVTNPSFEVNTTGWAAVGAGVTFTRDTTQFQTGIASAKVIGDGSTSGQGIFINPQLPASPSTTYTGSVYLRGNAGGESIKIDLRRQPGAAAIATQTVVLTTSWQRFSVTGTTASDSTAIYLLVSSSTATAMTWFADAAMIEQTATLGSYGDGSLSGWFWTGTAHASASTSGVTRLDLNDGVIWSASSETEFPAPPLKRSTASTLITDGEPIPASAYSNREIKLVLKLHSDDADTAATQYQLLMRELDRPTNILRYQPTGATEPVFFRTFRAAPDALVWPSEEIVKEVTATLIAEPFALGARENLGATTVSNDPAAGANGCFINYTGVKGDVETPLVLTHGGYVFSGSAYWGPGLAVGVRSGSSPYPTLFRQAEALTMGVSTSVVADATFSGGSKARCTFASNNWETRVSGWFPNDSIPSGPESRGVYRVFARVQATSLSTFTMGLSVFPGTGTSYQVNPYARTVDLGLFRATTAEPLAGGYESTAYSVNRMPLLSLLAQRTSGTGSLDIDYILLIPADESYGTWKTPNTSTASATAVVDSVNESVYSTVNPFTGSAQLGADANPVEFAGVYPYIKPGSNRVVIYQHTPADVSGVGSRITDTLSITGYYWPRYLHARPPTT